MTPPSASEATEQRTDRRATCVGLRRAAAGEHAEKNDWFFCRTTSRDVIFPVLRRGGVERGSLRTDAANNLPVVALTKCRAPPAGRGTKRCVSTLWDAAPVSQCCTFMPVRGHLNRMLRSMTPICAWPRAIEIASHYLRNCPHELGRERAPSVEKIEYRITEPANPTRPRMSVAPPLGGFWGLGGRSHAGCAFAREPNELTRYDLARSSPRTAAKSRLAKAEDSRRGKRHDRPAGISRMAASSSERPSISPGERGFEERTIECSTCERTEVVPFVVDPMKTDAVGWLAGELKPPQ